MLIFGGVPTQTMVFGTKQKIRSLSQQRSPTTQAIHIVSTRLSSRLAKTQKGCTEANQQQVTTEGEFPFLENIVLEPQTTIYTWMFQLDDSKSLYNGCLGFQGVKGIFRDPQ